MSKWIGFSVLLFAVGTAAFFSSRWWLSTTATPLVPANLIASVNGEPTKADEEVGKLIEKLKEPSSRVRYLGTIIPGGELLKFSGPMKELLRLGERARTLLHEHVNDPGIQNEVVLVLGAIGDRATVSLLIEQYPDALAKSHAPDNPQWMKTVCFTFALTYLTGQPIGRSRYGADCDPRNRELWQRWWHENGGIFEVSKIKPNASWLPSYPAQ